MRVEELERAVDARDAGIAGAPARRSSKISCAVRQQSWRAITSTTRVRAAPARKPSRSSVA